MNLLIRLFVMIPIILVIGCDQSPLGGGYKTREDERLVDLIEEKAALQSYKELGLQPIGSGAQMMDKIRKLTLCFQYNKPITPCEGRELLLKAIDIFLATINENEEIRPYLIRYPFEPKNIGIQIFLRNPDGSAISPGGFCCIVTLDGKLEYDIKHPATTRLETAYQETYQEAIAKLAANSTEPQVLIAPPPENLLDRPGAKLVPGTYRQAGR